MTPEQIALIESSFAKVKPIAAAAAAMFYARLFETAPHLRPLFKHDINEQGNKLMTTIGAAVGLLRTPEKLKPVVEGLGRSHLSYGVTSEHFAPVGAALIWTLEQGLGPDFTPEVRAAWLALYGSLSETMGAAMAVPA